MDTERNTVLSNFFAKYYHKIGVRDEEASMITIFLHSTHDFTLQETSIHIGSRVAAILSVWWSNLAFFFATKTCNPTHTFWKWTRTITRFRKNWQYVIDMDFSHRCTQQIVVIASKMCTMHARALVKKSAILWGSATIALLCTRKNVQLSNAIRRMYIHDCHLTNADTWVGVKYLSRN